MPKEKPIRRASADEIAAMLARGEGKSDWNSVRAFSQSEADRLAELEDGPLPECWADTVEIGVLARKEGVHIRLDADVLEWFRCGGPGYQTRINVVLKSFAATKRRSGKRTGGSPLLQAKVASRVRH